MSIDRRPYLRRVLPRFDRTLRAIEAAAADGAGSALAAQWTADAARDTGNGRDVLRVARALALRVRGTVVFAPDEYGTEDVQSVRETLETRRAGDCDDLAAAFLALARKAGIRGGVAVYRREGKPFHVFPVVEHPEGGAWLAVELTEPLPFGEFPDGGPDASMTVYPSQPRILGGVGFLPGLDGLFSFLGAKESAKGATKAAEVTARGALEIAKVQDATAERTNAANLSAVRLQAQAAIARSKRAQEGVASVLAFAREAVPYMVAVAALRALGALGASSAAPARKRKR